MTTRRLAPLRSPTWLAACKACGALALVAIVFLGAALAQTAAKPKLLPGAKPGDCAACHGKTMPIPKGHPAVTGKALSDCTTCHAKAGPMALRGRLPLSHVHQLSNVTCKSCHADSRKPQPAKSTLCLTCHSGEAIFAATASVQPRNPHGSPHYGKEADCNLCHHQHKKSENFCSECHAFEFKVP